MIKYDLIIAGAGISGASFASYAAEKGLRVLVVEPHHIGGSLNTLRYTDSEGNKHVVEMAAHTLYNSYKYSLELIEKHHEEISTVTRIKLPMLFFKDLQTKIKPKPHKVEGVKSLIKSKFKKPNKSSMTVKEYYSAMLGEKNYNDIVHYMFRAITSQEPSNFPADIIFQKREKNKSYPRNFSIKNGLSHLAETILKHENITVLKDEVITAENGVVSLKSGEKFSYDKLAMATPAATAGSILEKESPKLSELLKSIPTQKIYSKSYFYNLDSLLFSFKIFLTPHIISAVSSDNVNESLRELIPGTKKANLNLSENSLRAVTYHSLKPFDSQNEKIIQEGEIIKEADTISTLPSLNMEHKNILKSIKKSCPNNIFLLGNYFEKGMSIESCVERSKILSKKL